MNQSEILRQFYQWLKFYRAAGLEYLEKSPGTVALKESLKPQKAREEKPPARYSRHGTSGRADALSAGQFRKIKTRRQDERTPGLLPGLLKDASPCSVCPAAGRGSGPVHGSGLQNARLIVVGDMPGREDVRKGIPFQGEPGNMLTRMLRAIRIERSQAFLTLAIKCIPPEGDSYKDKIWAHCSKILLQEIKLIKPSFILALGTEAAKIILEESGCTPSDSEKENSISSLRGRVITLENSGLRLVVTHSPASMLRLGGNRLKESKREAWHDLQILEKIFHS
jgi:DNA polymerase